MSDKAWPLNNIFNFLSLTWQNANGAMLSDENLVQLLETDVLGVLPEALTYLWIRLCLFEQA